MNLAGMVKTLADLVNSQPNLIDGDSMLPSLESRQYVLARIARKGQAAPERGRIVLLRNPLERGRNLAKRVVGLPGETVSLDKGVTYVDGRILPEPYLKGARTAAATRLTEWVMGDDEYFVMGDNRADSLDSRTFGPVHRSLIRGLIWFRYWPPRSWGRVGLPGQ